LAAKERHRLEPRRGEAEELPHLGRCRAAFRVDEVHGDRRRFVRGEQGSAGAPGTGLGLYISRQLASRHGGRLELDRSIPGQGSRFSLRLPRAPLK